jgi:hypothetical protein
MGIATNQQVQLFSDLRIRPHCEEARAFLTDIQDDLAAIGDVYANLTGTGTNATTWTDSRTDNPPYLLQASDLLAINQFFTDISNDILNHPQYPIVKKAWVRPVSQDA